MDSGALNSRERRVAWGLVLVAAAWMIPADSPVKERSTPNCPGVWGELEAVQGRTTRMGCIPRGEDAEPIRGPARWLVGESIDLSQASLETLQILPGIGLRRAQRILRARCSGRLTNLNALLQIHGIGAKTVAGLRGQAFVGEGPVSRKECLGSSTLQP
ncbi:MAG: hypothetical protein CBC48_10910 [bacterium TMED88]|nr:hypothetical protein [Deltaproteobacteria bacterium]OUV30043.1 MAG: hypothetical protein CBC48_10910 [bacterium TMED88]